MGLNFDFVLLNLTKHSSYLIYNSVLFFSSTVQAQYRQKFGLNEVCNFHVQLSQKREISTLLYLVSDKTMASTFERLEFSVEHLVSECFVYL